MSSQHNLVQLLHKPCRPDTHLRLVAADGAHMKSYQQARLAGLQTRREEGASLGGMWPRRASPQRT